MDVSSKPLLVFIGGPTAAGKSQLAMEVAPVLGATILNCDSIQVYQRLNIGAAKPTINEMSLVRHLLVDIIPPGEKLTAGDFRRYALDVLKDDYQQNRRLHFGVGGSGFYFLALEKGMFERGAVPEDISNSIKEQMLTDRGRTLAWLELESFDPDYCKKISPNDTYRISRALEIVRAFSEKPSLLREKFAPAENPFRVKKFAVTRSKDEIFNRVKIRTSEMLKNGLLEETRKLVDDGFENWAPLSSVGYRECLQVLKGTAPISGLADAINFSTMRLVKKQLTWFKRDRDFEWVHPATDRLKVQEQIKKAQGY